MLFRDLMTPNHGKPFHMRHSLLLLPMMSGLLCQYTLFARDSAGGFEPYVHLKALEWLVGEWDRKYESPDGQIVTETMTFQWLYGQKFLRLAWERRLGDGPAESGEVTWLWDPVAKVIRDSALWPDGSWSRGTVEVDQASLRGSHDGIDGDGRGTSQTVVFERAGEDSFTLRILDKVVGGEPRPDRPVIEFRRKLTAVRNLGPGHLADPPPKARGCEG